MRHIRHLELVLIAMIIAVVARNFPLQHYMPLSRYQHWSIALYIWALGFFIQAAWSWRKLTTNGKIALIAAGTYVSGAAMALYTNPWLDTTVSLQTTEQAETRYLLSAVWAVGGVLVGIVWMRWGLVELDYLKRKEEQMDSHACEVGGGD